MYYPSALLLLLSLKASEHWTSHFPLLFWCIISLNLLTADRIHSRQSGLLWISWQQNIKYFKFPQMIIFIAKASTKNIHTQKKTENATFLSHSKACIVTTDRTESRWSPEGRSQGPERHCVNVCVKRRRQSICMFSSVCLIGIVWACASACVWLRGGAGVGHALPLRIRAWILESAFYTGCVFLHICVWSCADICCTPLPPSLRHPTLRSVLLSCFTSIGRGRGWKGASSTHVSWERCAFFTFLCTHVCFWQSIHQMGAVKF